MSSIVSTKTTVVKYQKLEIICNQGSVEGYRAGKISLDDTLVTREIYKDAKKADRASEADILGVFQHKDMSKALDEIIASTGKDNAEKYQKQIAADDDLEEKIKKLAAVRSKEGYMANYEKQEDGSYLLVENHCPICAAAKICQGFCKAELQTFKTVLGEDLKIKRVNHILAGAHRCAYKIEA